MARSQKSTDSIVADCPTRVNRSAVVDARHRHRLDHLQELPVEERRAWSRNRDRPQRAARPPVDRCGLTSSSRSPAGRLHRLSECVLHGGGSEETSTEQGERPGSRFDRPPSIKDIRQEGPTSSSGSLLAAGRSDCPVPSHLSLFVPPSNFAPGFRCHLASHDGPGVIFGVENVFFLQCSRNSVGPPHGALRPLCGATGLSSGDPGPCPGRAPTPTAL